MYTGWQSRTDTLKRKKYNFKHKIIFKKNVAFNAMIMMWNHKSVENRGNIESISMKNVVNWL